MISLARTVCCPHWMEVMWGEWDSLSPVIWVWEMFGCALKKKKKSCQIAQYMSTSFPECSAMQSLSAFSMHAKDGFVWRSCLQIKLELAWKYSYPILPTAGKQMSLVGPLNPCCILFKRRCLQVTRSSHLTYMGCALSHLFSALHSFSFSSINFQILSKWSS